ncbi:MAG: ankyrin repeat domain-containing protein [Pseudomonadota bacterium]
MTMVTTVCAETQVGGMTALQAFHDKATAEWVTAIEHDDYAKADRLLAQGAQVNMNGEEEITPLLWIMGGTRWEVQRLEYMLKAGADPNYVAPKRQVSPMYAAAGGDKPEILKLLLKHHGNPNLIAPDIVTGEARISFTAARQGRMENIQILLQHGLDINWQDKYEGTAANRALVLIRFDIIAYCLEHGLTAGLDKLATEISHMPMPDNTKMQPWKEKVIAILKERGADFEYKKRK